MSYIAIARKWRPKRFDEIAGQRHITKTLENAIARDRVHHAYLFSGPRGVGKTTAARTLARSLNCEQGPSLNPCMICSNCIEILAGNNPDVMEIDGASNNSVDDVRDLRESVQFLPNKSPKRIYIIDEVHMLSKGAFNALLKTLEEPPKHVLFIFATTEPQKIPDTILSRVQRFEFKRIPAKTVTAHLHTICAAEGIKIEEGGLQLIARAGEGSMRDSQSLLDQVISFGGTDITLAQVSDALGLIDRSLIYNMLEGIVFTDPERCLHAINRVYDYGYDLSEFSSELLELIRNATMVQLTEESNQFLDISDSEYQQLQKIANKTTPDILVRSFQVMLEIHEQLTHSTRPKLVLEMAVARLISIRPVRSIDSLIERLGKIEGGPRPRENSDDPLPARGVQKTQPKSITTSKKSHSSSGEEKSHSAVQPTIKRSIQPSPPPKEHNPPVQKEKPPVQKEKPPIQKEKPPVSSSEPHVESSPHTLSTAPILSPEQKPSPEQKSSSPSINSQKEKIKERLKKTKHIPPDPPPKLNKEDAQKRDEHFLLFELVREALFTASTKNDVLANYACILEKNPTLLRLGISEGFKLDHIHELLKSTEIRAVFSEFFPTINKITAVSKPQNVVMESYFDREKRIREEKRHSITTQILNSESYQLFTRNIPTKFQHLTLEDEATNDNN